MTAFVTGASTGFGAARYFFCKSGISSDSMNARNFGPPPE